ncbi:MAG: hypothetical protein DI562_08420 [Stenotrophomonas acidaminiphila]|nr:MAG: hypothetical protein DI562_08420 [Stenotrophomonas acidaminiphila]
MPSHGRRMRDAARSDVFDYIEMFCNPERRHGSNGGVSTVELERQAGFQARRCLRNTGRVKPLLHGSRFGWPE